MRSYMLGLQPQLPRGNRVATLKEEALNELRAAAMELGQGRTARVTAPGARAFYNRTEYAHGGVSPQECVLPVIDRDSRRRGTCFVD